MTRFDFSKLLVLDQPDVLRSLFHPRAEDDFRLPRENREDLMIPVEENISLAASCHFAKFAKSAPADAPLILFFHGNGEIVADYDDIAHFYNDLGIHFFVVDYRGYGRSSGMPTVTGMMKDCHIVLDFVLSYKINNRLTGPVCLMGRSLGSASVIELAAKREDDIACLIVESGFACAGPLLRILGIDPDRIGYREQEGFENIDKISLFSKPCLVIHAQYDHIIAFSDGQALFDAVASKEKFFLEVKGANHNDIFFRGMTAYLDHIQKICFL
ncbi:MAG: alpha/beta hydrolase [Pseudomonadota bacterium]